MPGLLPRKINVRVTLAAFAAATIGAVVVMLLEWAMFDWKHPPHDPDVLAYTHLISSVYEGVVLALILTGVLWLIVHRLIVRRLKAIQRMLHAIEGEPAEAITLPAAAADGDEIDALRAALHRVLCRLKQQAIERQGHLDQLQRIEARLRESQSMARLGSWEFDPNDRSYWWSRQVYLIFGHDPDGPLPPLDEHLRQYHPDDLPMLERMLDAAGRDGTAFHARFRIQPRDGVLRWTENHGFCTRDADGRVVRITGTTQDITAQVDRETALKRLASELDHRVKNNLGSVIALIRQTAADFDDVPAFAERLTARVFAMARAHEIISGARLHGADLREMIDLIVAPHGGAVAERMSMCGPSVAIAAAAASPLSLTLNELANNAAKHGAFTQDDARLQVRWALEDNTLSIDWHETLPRPIEQELTAKTGLHLARGFIEHQLDGRLRVDVEPEGLRLSIRLPAATVIAPSQAPEHVAVPPGHAVPQPSYG
jgi:PAS domain S-box-containing protein